MAPLLRPSWVDCYREGPGLGLLRPPGQTRLDPARLGKAADGNRDSPGFQMAHPGGVRTA
jgi:hypothetical protein